MVFRDATRELHLSPDIEDSAVKSENVQLNDQEDERLSKLMASSPLKEKQQDGGPIGSPELNNTNLLLDKKTEGALNVKLVEDGISLEKQPEKTPDPDASNNTKLLTENQPGEVVDPGN